METESPGASLEQGCRPESEAVGRLQPVIEPSRVTVTAADFNGRDWDGSPFDHTPDWFRAAISRGKITPHTRNCTDYAEWDVNTTDGVVSAGPGDQIEQGPDGLRVLKKTPPSQVGTPSSETLSR